MQKLYSPNQIGMGSYLGGPIATVWFLRKNFKALGMAEAVRNTSFLGALFVAGIIYALPFVPDSVPNYLIPAIYSAVGVGVSSSYQKSKADIKSSDDYAFQSNWRVFFLSIVCFALFLTLALAGMFAMDSLGLISIEDM